MSAADVVVRPSRIQGLGIFAARDFQAGEIILSRDESREVTDERPLHPELGEFDRHCDYLAGGRVVLLGYPERHFNHCCDPSAYLCFIDGVGQIRARREIATGEEITNDYCINGAGDGVWTCACGNRRCRKTIQENFFAEPPNVQREYLSLLADWFITEHPREVAALRASVGR